MFTWPRTLTSFHALAAAEADAGASAVRQIAATAAPSARRVVVAAGFVPRL